jgi:hypothetical protein
MFINIGCFFILLVILYLLYYNFNTCGYNQSTDESEDFEVLDDDNKNYFDLKYSTPMGYNMDKIICSKNCCSTQWPTSISTRIKDPKIDMNEYLPTNLNCNDGINDTGCICKKKTI